MRKLCLLMLFSVFSFSGNCKSYLDYHLFVNKAEGFLVSEKYDSAFLYYDKAFESFDYIFAKDAYIAAQLAWQQKDTGKTIHYLVKGAECGLRSACLDNCRIFSSFVNAPFYEAVYDSMRAANLRYNSTVDHDLRNGWKNRMSALVMAEDVSSFLSVIAENVAYVKELIASGKYPGERIIGLSDDCNALSNNTVFYSLANYDCVVTEMHDVLWSEVKDGLLHPREFATLWEWEYVRSAEKPELLNKRISALILSRFVSVHMKENVSVSTNRNCGKGKHRIALFNLLLDLPEVSTEELNKNRAAYFICSLEVDNKKRELETKYGYRFFFENK